MGWWDRLAGLSLDSYHRVFDLPVAEMMALTSWQGAFCLSASCSTFRSCNLCILAFVVLGRSWRYAYLKASRPPYFYALQISCFRVGCAVMCMYMYVCMYACMRMFMYTASEHSRNANHTSCIIDEIIEP